MSTELERPIAGFDAVFSAVQQALEKAWDAGVEAALEASKIEEYPMTTSEVNGVFAKNPYRGQNG